LPHGEAAELARALGLGARRTVSVLQRERPPTEWIEALGAEDGGDAPLCWPVDGGVLWRRFGAVRHHGRRRFHRGIDVGAPAGALIRSVRRGLVAYSDNGIQGYGNILLIVHADESVAWYAHCQATYVFAGQVVRRGQVIGEVGATGIAQGAHLHFEMRREGRAFDPLPLFDSPPIAPRASR
jgi:murein DD-endopeptidase MepM/ murein hydrolase activator NlpD